MRKRSVVTIVIAALFILLCVHIGMYLTIVQYKALIVYGSDLGGSDRDGWTPLHHASAGGNIEMAEYLLGKGVDMNARTKKGETAYHIAIFFRHPQLAEYLASEGVETSGPDFPDLSGPYMGQKPPGDEPMEFLPGIVSIERLVHTPVIFSPGGDEAYWTDMLFHEGGVMSMKMLDGKWTFPVLSDRMRGEPAFSPDGKRLYFISLKPLREGEEGGKENIWFMERTTSGWSDPVQAGDAVNSRNIHWQPSVDIDYNLYFSDYNHIYYSEYRDGEYRQPIDISVLYENETLAGSSPCVSPDGKMILFTAKKGLRGSNLCVTFKRPDGSWTDRVDLGAKINAGRSNWAPRLTPDGKYIFFASAGNGRTWGIYWVSAEVLELLRKEAI